MKEHTFAFTPVVLTIDGAAHYLSVSRRTIEEYLIRGDLTPIALPRPSNGKRSGHIKHSLIAREELDRLVVERALKK